MFIERNEPLLSKHNDWSVRMESAEERRILDHRARTPIRSTVDQSNARWNRNDPDERPPPVYWPSGREDNHSRIVPVCPLVPWIASVRRYRRRNPTKIQFVPIDTSLRHSNNINDECSRLEIGCLFLFSCCQESRVTPLTFGCGTEEQQIIQKGIFPRYHHAADLFFWFSGWTSIVRWGTGSLHLNGQQRAGDFSIALTSILSASASVRCSWVRFTASRPDVCE